MSILEPVILGGIDYVVLSPAPGVMRLRIATASPTLTNASCTWNNAATAFREAWEQHPNVVLVVNVTTYGIADWQTAIEVRRAGVATVEMEESVGYQRHYEPRMMIAIPFQCFIRDAYNRYRKLKLLIAD